MTLEEHIKDLSEDKQFAIAINMIKLALPIWDKYAEQNELTYYDSVVGLKHEVERDLLKETVAEVEKHFSTSKTAIASRKSSNLLYFSEQFTDPIVALQDTDWELPKEVEKIFYAVHNLLDAAIGQDMTVFNEATIYVSINQATDALQIAKTITEESIREILYEN